MPHGALPAARGFGLQLFQACHQSEEFERFIAGFFLTLRSQGYLPQGALPKAGGLRRASHSALRLSPREGAVAVCGRSGRAVGRRPAGIVRREHPADAAALHGRMRCSQGL